MRFIQFSIPLLAMLVVGCSSASKPVRNEISGAVSYRSQPVDNGEIVFEPSVLGLPMAIGKIQNGKYQIEAEHGPALGSYNVKITAFRKRMDPNLTRPPYLGDDQQEVVVNEQFIPSKYNVETTLKVDVAAGTNAHDFSLD